MKAAQRPRPREREPSWENGDSEEVSEGSPGTRLFVGRNPALLGTVDAALLPPSASSPHRVRQPRMQSLDLNSVVDDTDYRSSFAIAMREGVNAATAGGGDDAEVEGLLLTVPKLSALLNAARSKGGNFYERAQEMSRKRLEATYSPRREDAQTHKPFSDAAPVPQSKPVQFSARSRPKSSGANTRVLRRLAGEEDEDGSPPGSAPSPVTALALELGAEMAKADSRISSPLASPRDQLTALNRLSFVRNAKAIPPPTFVSVCLPTVPAHGASVPSVPGSHPSAGASSSGATLPSIASPSRDSLVQQVTEMLRRDDAPAALVLPDDIRADPDSWRHQQRRAQSAGMARSRGKRVSYDDEPPPSDRGPLGAQLGIPSPSAPQRRNVHSAGISPRARMQPQRLVSARSARSDRETSPESRMQTLDHFMWALQDLPNTGNCITCRAASPTERAGSPGGAATGQTSPRTRVMLLAHRIVQQLDLQPVPTETRPDRRYDVPVSILAAPSALQRLIEEEQDRVRDSCPAAAPAAVSLPDEMVEAMDKQRLRFSELSKRPPSPQRSLPRKARSSSPPPASRRSRPQSDEQGGDEVRSSQPAPITSSPQEGAGPAVDEAMEPLVLNWRAFVGPEGEGQPAPAVPPSIPDERPRSQPGSQPATSRRPELKVLQFDVADINALFRDPPTAAGSAEPSWIDEDYMNANSVLAEYAVAAKILHPDQREVQLNPKVPSERIHRRPAAARLKGHARTAVTKEERDSAAGQREVGLVGVMAMSTTPAVLLPRVRLRPGHK